MDIQYTVAANGIVYRVVDDFTSTYRVIATGKVSDAVLPSAPAISVASSRPDVDVRALSNGEYAVCAYVERSFPKLSTTGYTLALTVTAPGCVEQTVTVLIPLAATFPVSIPAVALRRKPVRIRGRVVTDTAVRSPIAGALVMSIDDTSTPGAPHLVLLGTTVSQDFLSGTTVQRINTATTGSTNLLEASHPTTDEVRLASRAGLAAGSVLRFAAAGGAVLDFGIAKSFGPGPLSAAGSVFLRKPLRSSFPAGAAVDFVVPAGVVATETLLSPSFAGSAVLDVSNPLSAGTIEIAPATLDVEYRQVGATTGADGYYSIDGVDHARRLLVQASHAGFTTVQQPCMVDFDHPVNTLDFRLP